MDDSAENKSGKKKAKKYIVTRPQKVVSEYGYDPSLARYLLSRSLVPVVLTFVFALIKGGPLFIIIMWTVFVAKHMSNYYELYPKTRPATEEEKQWYYKKVEVEKERELVRIKVSYDSDSQFYDEYGWMKLSSTGRSREYDELMRAYNGEIPHYYEEKKEKWLNRLEEKRLRIEEADKEYGPNWFEDFQKDLEKYGWLLDIK